MPMETWNLLIYVMETTFTRRRNSQDTPFGIILTCLNIFFSDFSKDARLPVQLQRAMAAEAEAAREARAKVSRKLNSRAQIWNIDFYQFLGYMLTSLMGLKRRLRHRLERYQLS